MGMHLGSGGHENTVKTHKNDESNFHLKGGSGLGPTKQSGAFPAEGSHREGSLRHHHPFLPTSIDSSLEAHQHSVQLLLMNLPLGLLLQAISITHISTLRSHNKKASQLKNFHCFREVFKFSLLERLQKVEE